MTNYVLKYFDTRGRAEVIRMMFAYGNIDYEDRRLSYDEWRTIRKRDRRIFSLPWLEMDGEVYCQAKAIGEYVAGTLDLLPNNPLEMLKFHMVIDTAFDLNAAFFGVVHATDKYDENKEKFLKKKALLYCYELETLSNKLSNWIISDKLTLCDFYVFETLDSKIKSIDSTFLDQFPKLKDIYRKVRELEELRGYFLHKRGGWKLEIRPKHHELKNQVISSYEIQIESISSSGSAKEFEVEIQLFGENDNTQRMKLNIYTAVIKKSLFGDNSLDVFLVDGKNLRKITHVKMNLTEDCTLDKWRITAISINNLSTKKTTRFNLDTAVVIGKVQVQIPLKKNLNHKELEVNDSLNESVQILTEESEKEQDSIIIIETKKSNEKRKSDQSPEREAKYRRDKSDTSEAMETNN
ncbi:hypothetical protein SNEBB_001111 [Seison nebaliae]|nr:hypothetical protein SNEBB_001111 [Seison nebaliae]